MAQIIAEIGSVHDGSIGNALRLVDLAKEVGADIVKFQYHIAEEETLLDAPSPSYFQDETRYSFFQRTSFSSAQWRRIIERSDEQGIGFCCSPFSIKALDELVGLGVRHFKLASGEVTNLPLVKRMAQLKNCSIYISSGMSNWEEIDNCLACFDSFQNLVLMQCTSMYPCSPEYVGLNVIAEMQDRYQGLQIGFSDHTVSNIAALGAVFFGASVVEKHLTFSKAMYGSDAANAAEPEQFRQLVQDVKEAGCLMENLVDKSDNRIFSEMKLVFEKSVVASRPLKKGHRLRLNDLAFKKPGSGLRASQYELLLGRSLNCDIGENDFITVENLL